MLFTDEQLDDVIANLLAVPVDARAVVFRRLKLTLLRLEHAAAMADDEELVGRAPIYDGEMLEHDGSDDG